MLKGSKEERQRRADKNAALEREEMAKKAEERAIKAKKERDTAEKIRRQKEEESRAAARADEGSGPEVTAELLRDCNIHGLLLERLELKRAIPRDEDRLLLNEKFVSEMEARIDLVAKDNQLARNIISEAAVRIAGPNTREEENKIVGLVNKFLAKKDSAVEYPLEGKSAAQRWAFEMKYTINLIQRASEEKLILEDNLYEEGRCVFFDYDSDEGRNIVIDFGSGRLSIFSKEGKLESSFSEDMQQIRDAEENSRPVKPQEYYMALLALQNGLSAASKITEEKMECFREQMKAVKVGEGAGVLKEFRDGYYMNVDPTQNNVSKFGENGFFRLRNHEDGDMIDIVDEDRILHPAVSDFELESFLQKHSEIEVEEEKEELSEEEIRVQPDGNINNDINGVMGSPYKSQLPKKLMVNKGVISENMPPEWRASHSASDYNYFRITPSFLSATLVDGRKRHGDNFLHNAEFAGLYLDELLRPDEGSFFDKGFPPLGATFRNCVLSINFANFTPKTLKSLTFQDCEFTIESLETLPVGFRFDAMQFREAVRDGEGKVIPRTSPVFAENPPLGVPCEPFPDDAFQPTSVSEFQAMTKMLQANSPFVRS